MKQTILIITVLLTAVAARGQNLPEQKACYVQAQKVADKSVQWSNHFDGKTCWVEEWTNSTSTPVVYSKWVFNAFEKNSTEAYFMGEMGKQPVACNVGVTRCVSTEEFDKLVSKKYGF